MILALHARSAVLVAKIALNAPFASLDIILLQQTAPFAPMIVLHAVILQLAVLAMRACIFPVLLVFIATML